MAIDVSEFLKTHAAKHKKSPLWEYESQIRQLMAKGTSIPTIRAYLSANGLDMSENWIRKFVKRLKETTQDKSNHETKTQKITTPPAASVNRPNTATTQPPNSSDIDELLRLKNQWQQKGN